MSIFKRKATVFLSTILLLFFLSGCNSPVPEISIPDQTISEGEELSVDLSKHTKIDGKASIIYTIGSGVGSVRDSTFIYKPDFADSGTRSVSILAKTEKGKESKTTFNITVLNVNRPPAISIENSEIAFGEEITIDLEAASSDPDGDVLTFAVSDESLSIEDGNLLVKASSLKPGTNSITVLARDPEGAEASTTFSIEVKTPSFSADGNTLIVDKAGDEFTSIQKAVDAAKTGDTVLIMPGVYEENVSVSKSIIIAGASKDSVILLAPEGNTAGIYVRSVDGITIRDITIKTPATAVQFSRSSGEIIGVIIKGGRFGISYSGAAGNVLKIDDCLFSAFESETTEEKLAERLTGLYVYGSGHLIVENSLFFRNGTGLYISNDTSFSISDSVFEKNTVALSITGTARGTVEKNRITGNIDNGVLLRSTSTIEFSSNIFYRNARHGFDLYLRSCTDCGCGGTVFNGTVLGSGNVFDDEKAICPRDFSWPEGFYTVDEQISKTN